MIRDLKGSIERGRSWGGNLNRSQSHARPGRLVSPGSLLLVSAIAMSACGAQTQEGSTGTVAAQASQSPTATEVSTLGLNPEQLTDRYNSQASEDARIEDMEIMGSEFSARIDPTLRIYGSLAANGQIASASVVYTGSTTARDDPFYDILADGMEQLRAIIAFSNFCSATAMNATEDEANRILTDLDYPAGEGAGSLEGINTEATVAGVMFRLHDAGLDGIVLTAEPAP